MPLLSGHFAMFNPLEIVMTKRETATVLAALDALAIGLPDNYRWPKRLRLAYERAVKLLLRGRLVQGRDCSR